MSGVVTYTDGSSNTIVFEEQTPTVVGNMYQSGLDGSINISVSSNAGIDYVEYELLGETHRIEVDNSLMDVQVEIQIRTVAMDFWASLEHKIYYKYEGEDAPEHIQKALIQCASMVSDLD